jgi:hypothetical protein
MAHTTTHTQPEAREPYEPPRIQARNAIEEPLIGVSGLLMM